MWCPGTWAVARRLLSARRHVEGLAEGSGGFEVWLLQDVDDGQHLEGSELQVQEGSLLHQGSLCSSLKEKNT